MTGPGVIMAPAPLQTELSPMLPVWFAVVCVLLLTATAAVGFYRIYRFCKDN